jgi:hypothetical protein
MTAPLTPVPERTVLAVLFGLAAVAVAIPFGQRDDWVGWAAFLTVAAVATGLWGLMIRGFWRRTRR